MIGLFLGSTDFPQVILKTLKKKKRKHFIIDLTKNNFFKNDRNSHFISIGKFGQILKLIKDKKCNKVLFAGKIDKPSISNLKLDIKSLSQKEGISDIEILDYINQESEKLIEEYSFSNNIKYIINNDSCR